MLPHVAKYVQDMRCVLRVATTLRFATVSSMTHATAVHPAAKLLARLLTKSHAVMIIFEMCDKPPAQILSIGGDYVLAAIPPAHDRGSAFSSNRNGSRHSWGCLVTPGEVVFA
jgi:hypothetical protein